MQDRKIKIEKLITKLKKKIFKKNIYFFKKIMH